MRASLGLALVIVVGLVGTAEARRGGGVVVINTGDAIIHLKDLPSGVALETPAADDNPIGGADAMPRTFGKLGYRHELFGVFWFDLWRWGGEFVIYDGNTYIPISDEMADELGGSVPWRYHLPDGLLILVAVAYFAFIGRRRRAVKTTLYIAGFMLALAVAFFFMGLTWEFLIPLVIALHHGLSARAAHQSDDADEPVETASKTTEVDDAPVIPRASAPRMAPSAPSAPRPVIGTPPPVEASVPSRPSQPLVVERPVAPPVTAVPMRADDSVDGPKLLR